MGSKMHPRPIRRKDSSCVRSRRFATHARHCCCRSQCGRRRRNASRRPSKRAHSESPPMCRTSSITSLVKLPATDVWNPAADENARCVPRVAHLERGRESRFRSRRELLSARPLRLQSVTCVLPSGHRTYAVHGPSMRPLECVRFHRAG